ncbi:MFS transporter [Paraburkholderia sp. Cy-641]|uniref:MFS transporter n=1 Tax=Paraburkholderia sp. Cy-641 TaxID=2608337 RepID=UPI00142324D4|nr:MFS transporter [Paraburkholderia sp. Cy-641]
MKAVAGWYDKHLGFALGLALMLSRLGVALLPPLSAALIDSVGWRAAYLCLGVFVWLVSVPSVHWLLHEPPRGGSIVVPVSRDATGNKSTGLSLSAALLTRAFWLMALSFFLISVVVGAGTWVLPIVLSDYGLKAQQGASVMTVVGIAMMVGRVGCGALLDRFFAPWITAAVFVGTAIGYVCLSAGISVVTVPVAAILIGFTLGSEIDALAYMTSRVFDRRHLGAIYGSLMFCFSVGLGCGPALFAQIFARTGSYQIAFQAAVVAAVVAALAVFGLRRSDLRFHA